jgi:hypothetical protein
MKTNTAFTLAALLFVGCSSGSIGSQQQSEPEESDETSFAPASGEAPSDEPAAADSARAEPEPDPEPAAEPEAEDASAVDTGSSVADSATAAPDTKVAKDTGSGAPDTKVAVDTSAPDTKVAVDSSAPDTKVSTPDTSLADSSTGVVDTGSAPTPVWRTANLTTFTSYPDPGSEECIAYNGCTWAGQFAALSSKQPESWVKANNIAAVHGKDFAAYKLKTLRLRQGTKTIDVKVYDMCADSDCSGCCTANSKSTGFLIDVEKDTAQRFGTSSGIVEWTCLDC